MGYFSIFLFQHFLLVYIKATRFLWGSYIVTQLKVLPNQRVFWQSPQGPLSIVSCHWQIGYFDFLISQLYPFYFILLSYCPKTFGIALYRVCGEGGWHPFCFPGISRNALNVPQILEFGLWVCHMQSLFYADTFLELLGLVRPLL